MTTDPINVPSLTLPDSPHKTVAACINYSISRLYRRHFPTRSAEFRIDPQHRWLEWTFRPYLDRSVDMLYLFGDRYLLVPGCRVAISRQEAQLCWSEAPPFHSRERQIIERFCLRLQDRTTVLREPLQWLCRPPEI